MEQFRIEVANGDRAHTFSVKELGGEKYEIFKEDERIGAVQMDDKDHAHCKTIDCEIDMPLLNSIREGIALHYKLNSL